MHAAGELSSDSGGQRGHAGNGQWRCCDGCSSGSWGQDRDVSKARGRSCCGGNGFGCRGSGWSQRAEPSASSFRAQRWRDTRSQIGGTSRSCGTRQRRSSQRIKAGRRCASAASGATYQVEITNNTCYGAQRELVYGAGSNTFWHVEGDSGALTLIDELRQRYIATLGE